MQYVHETPRFCQQFADECSCLRFLCETFFYIFLTYTFFFLSVAFEYNITQKIARFFIYTYTHIVCCWVCVIRLWARYDKPIQTKLFSSCHIEISFIVSYFSSGTPLLLTCINDRFFFSILMPSLFRNGFFSPFLFTFFSLLPRK